MSNYNEPWNKYIIPTKKELTKDRNNLNIKQIVSKYNVSRSVIFRWFNKLNIIKEKKRYHKICIICNKIFYKKPYSSLEQFSRRKTCSNLCLNKQKSILNLGKNNPMYDKIPYNKGKYQNKSFCKYCNKEFHFYISNSKGVFCSKNCFGKYYSGKNNHNWSEGKKYTYGKIWKLIRTEVLYKYKYKCVKCGLNKNLDVHHIIPFRKVKEHKIENLIVLCRSCHRKEEWINKKNGK